MKQTIILLAAIALTGFTSIAQKVEDQLWGVSVGISPLSVYNETALGKQIALRSELNVGFAWLAGNAYSGSSEWGFIPVIILEPRYYYNLQKRYDKGKHTHNNSGNYLSLNLGYQPGLIIGTENLDIHPSLHIIPTFGFRRSIGQHFNFSSAIGLGYSWIFKTFKYRNWDTGAIESYKYTEKGVTAGFQLNIGYAF